MKKFRSICDVDLNELPDEKMQKFVKRRIVETENDLFRNDGVKSQFYFHNATNEILKLQPPVWNGYKDQLANRIRRISKDYNADWILTIFEAWVGGSNEVVRPSESPNRKEMVLFQIETLNINYRASSEIRYKADKKVLLQIKFEKNIKNLDSCGRFENVICESPQ
jgi:hypothetical protein